MRLIHYHGTPFSGNAKTRLALAGKHALVSFARPDDIEIVAEVCQSFMLDNGAFTTWKLGHVYDAEAFLQWAIHWLRHPGCDFALIPDIIDGDEAANDAALAMVPQASPKWAPVWHMHESLERLERLSHEWPRVALGSSGEYATVASAKWWQRIAAAMLVLIDADGLPRCKLHGLRMLRPTVLERLPLSSADSTNAGRNIGLDQRWTGAYAPRSKYIRALLLIDRIESQPVASKWIA